MNVRRGDAPSDPGYPSRRQLLKAGVMLGAAAGLVGCRLSGRIPSDRACGRSENALPVQPPDPETRFQAEGELNVGPGPGEVGFQAKPLTLRQEEPVEHLMGDIAVDPGSDDEYQWPGGILPVMPATPPPGSPLPPN